MKNIVLIVIIAFVLTSSQAINTNLLDGPNNIVQYGQFNEVHGRDNTIGGYDNGIQGNTNNVHGNNNELNGE